MNAKISQITVTQKFSGGGYSVRGTLTECDEPAIVAYEIHSHVETRAWPAMFFTATDCSRSYDRAGIKQPASDLLAAGVGAAVDVHGTIWSAFPGQAVHNAICAPTINITQCSRALETHVSDGREAEMSAYAL